MNSILFFPDEIVEPFQPGVSCSLVVRSPRLERLKSWHDLQPGKSMRALLFRFGRGEAVLETLTESAATFRATFAPLVLPRLGVTVIVGLSRPQTVKKVVQASVTLGVEHLIFFKTERGEKSYLRSKILAPDALKQEITVGLEQAVDPFPPEVSVLAHAGELKESAPFQRILNDSRPRVLLDTTCGASTEESTTESPCAIAVGPEAGWSPQEVEFFLRTRFQPRSLGVRILRVETALCAALGGLLLRNSTSSEEG